jgi:amino acid adenylation domain-containing protein
LNGVSVRAPDGGHGQAVHGLVADWVCRQPLACAVRESTTGRSVTYRELWDRSSALAAGLSRRGVRHGDLVAVGMDPSIDMIVAFLGIIQAGAAYLPLDNHAPTQRLSVILADASCDLVICSSGSGNGTGNGKNGTWLDRLPRDVRLVRLPAAPEGPPAEQEPPAEPEPVDGDDPVYVAYTSGSTGRPKGVVVPHRAVIRLVVEPNYCTIAPGDRVANLSNPAFDATTFEVWSTLTAGGTVVVYPSATELAIDDWVACLEREQITTMFLTTSLFHTMARERPAAFRTLDNLVVGGEQLDIGMVRRVHAAGGPRRLVNGYGPTETTTFAAAFTCSPENIAGLDRLPIGFPLQRTALHILDEELEPVARGETGELFIAGPGVAIGYQHQPQLTAERFVLHPGMGTRLYRTGDLARQLPSGAVEVVGRRDRQVKLRGFRIELEEIEKAIEATRLVDSVFVEKTSEGPSAVLVAFVLAALPATAEPAEPAEPAELIRAIQARLASRLPEYMIPGRWHVLDRVPLGPTGKADRAQMRALLEQPPQAAPPAGSGEGCDNSESAAVAIEPMRQVWQSVLGVPVTAADGFLELGGNSILAVQAASRISQQLGQRVEPVDILLAGSLGELAVQLCQPITVDR